MKKLEHYTDKSGKIHEYGKLSEQFDAYVEKYLHDLIENAHDANISVRKETIEENVYDVYYVDDTDKTQTSYTKMSFGDVCKIEITKHFKYRIIGDIWIYER